MILLLILPVQIQYIIMQESNIVNLVPNPEYNKISANRVVYMQFCTNCDSHLFTIKHNEQKYLNHYEQLKQKLLESGIVVKKKPVPKDLFRKSPYCPPNVFYKQNGQIVYFPEIGSFEVYSDEVKIFSKLQSKKWPSASHIIQALKSVQRVVKIQNKDSFQPKIQNQVTPADKVIEKNTKRYSYLMRKPPLQAFRYSLEKRNLLSMRENRKRILSSQKMSNRSSFSKIAQDHKQMEIIKMYNPKIHDQKLQKKKSNLTSQIISIKYQKAIVYLEPLFPKTKFNLQNYLKHKIIQSERVHREKVSYLASKDYKEKQEHFQLIEKRNIKAKLNKDFSMLSNIKEVTQQQEQKTKAINQLTQQKNMQTNNEKVIKQQQHKEQSKQNVESSNQTIKSNKNNQNLRVKEQKSLKEIFCEQRNHNLITDGLKEQVKKQSKNNKNDQKSNQQMQGNSQINSSNNYQEPQFQQLQPQPIISTKGQKIS